MICTECSGSGACDPCDGYGTLPDSSPNAGDGVDCTVCAGEGICPDCTGSGTTENDQHDTNPIHDNGAAALWKASA